MATLIDIAVNILNFIFFSFVLVSRARNKKLNLSKLHKLTLYSVRSFNTTKRLSCLAKKRTLKETDKTQQVLLLYFLIPLHQLPFKIRSCRFLELEIENFVKMNRLISRLPVRSVNELDESNECVLIIQLILDGQFTVEYIEIHGLGWRQSLDFAD